jgi:hypothetical protein
VTVDSNPIADCDDEMATAQQLRIAERRRARAVRQAGSQQREIRVRIIADHVGVAVVPVDERHAYAPRACDHVAIRQHQPIGGDDDTRTDAAATTRSAAFDTHDGRADIVGYLAHDAGIGVQRRFGVRRFGVRRFGVRRFGVRRFGVRRCGVRRYGVCRLAPVGFDFR